MRRLLVVGVSGVLLCGCAGTEVTGPPPDPVGVPEAAASARNDPPPGASTVSGWQGALDDLIERLGPALGPAGAALGAPLHALGRTPDGRLLAAVRRQFDAIADDLPPDLLPDADAFRLTLDALGAAGGQ